MIAVSTIVFNVEITPLNGAGILVVLAGSARYSYVSVMEKSAATKAVVMERDEESGSMTTPLKSNIETPDRATELSKRGKN